MDLKYNYYIPMKFFES